MKVGIDVGTTLTKAVLFGDDGAILERRAGRTTLLHPTPGAYEVTVEEVVASVFGLLTELPTDRVELIALTGQGDGLWLLDEQARPLRPALSWLDGRGSDVCTSWEETGAASAIFKRTGNAPFPGAGAALLGALETLEPATLDRARTATQCQHVLFERLTGVRTATRSCALLPVFNPFSGQYDPQALALAGLAPWHDLLPPIAGPAAALAPIRDTLADALRLPRGVLMATGPYDLPAAALGVGTLQPGDGLLILGTTLACQVLRQEMVPTGGPVGLTLCTGDDRGWLRAMPAMVGTACLDWGLGLVGREHGQLADLLAASPPGANGVSALPFLSPSGERAPFIDPSARAELTGLSLEATAADVVRAVCEALAFAARSCFEAAGLTGDVVVCGGAATNDALVRLFADVLNRPLTVAADEEPAARGAVAAAEIVLGRSLAPPTVRAVVQPERAQSYAHDYAAYLERVEGARRHHWHRSAPTDVAIAQA